MLSSQSDKSDYERITKHFWTFRRCFFLFFFDKTAHFYTLICTSILQYLQQLYSAYYKFVHGRSKKKISKIDRHDIVMVDVRVCQWSFGLETKISWHRSRYLVKWNSRFIISYYTRPDGTFCSRRGRIICRRRFLAVF